jgi:hypothetical protein
MISPVRRAKSQNKELTITQDEIPFNLTGCF